MRETPRNIDYILTLEFDKFEGEVIRNQYPLNEDGLISEQVPNLNLIPSQLHKSLNRENWTLLPVYVAPDGKVSLKDSPESAKAVAMTLSVFQEDDSYRNGTAKGITLITSIPYFHAFKPLLTMLSHSSLFKEKFEDFVFVYNSLNSLPLDDMQDFFGSLSFCKRLPLLRILEYEEEEKAKGNTVRMGLETHIFAQNRKLFDNLTYLESNKSFKFEAELTNMPFPLKIPLKSLIGSPIANFGYDLENDQIIRSFVSLTQRIKTVKIIGETRSVPLVAPYGLQKTPVLLIIIYAVILKQRIMVYAYDTPINELTEFVLALIMTTSNSFADCFPYLDLAQMDLLEGLDSFVVGTSNPLFTSPREGNKYMWDVLYDLDKQEVTINPDRDQKIIKVGKRPKPSKSEGPRFLKRTASFFRRRKTSTTPQSRTPSVSVSDLNDEIRSISAMTISTSSSHLTASSALPPACDHEMIEQYCDFPSGNSVGSVEPKKLSTFFSFGFDDDLTMDNLSLSGAELERDPSGEIIFSQRDTQFLEKLEKFITEKHDDLSFYIAIQSYTFNLKQNVLPGLEIVKNNSVLELYRKFASGKLEISPDDWKSTDLKSELARYIRKRKIVQMLPLGLETAFDIANGPLSIEDFSIRSLNHILDHYAQYSQGELSSMYQILETYPQNSILKSELRSQLLGYKSFVYYIDLAYLIECFHKLTADGYSDTFLANQVSCLFRYINMYITDESRLDVFLNHVVQLETEQTLFHSLENIVWVGQYFQEKNPLVQEEFQLFLQKFNKTNLVSSWFWDNLSVYLKESLS